MIHHTFVDLVTLYINTNKVLAESGQIAYNVASPDPLSSFMRLTIVVCIACAALLTSCAYEGVIVQKDAQPLPFTHTAGIDGSYAFLLRDNTGTVRRQIVTPEVYNQYAIGEYFNDLQPAPTGTRDTTIDPKVVQTAMTTKPKTTGQLAGGRTSTSAPKVAVKPVAKPANVAASSASAGAKPVAVAAKSTPVAPRSATVAATVPAVATPKASTVSVASMTAVTKPAAAPKAAIVAPKPNIGVSKPAATSLAAAPVPPKVTTVATRPASAGASSTPVAAKPAVRRVATAPLSKPAPAVVASRQQHPAIKTTAAPLAQPFRQPVSADEPPPAFMVVARCR